MRRRLSPAAFGASLAGLLAVSLSQHHADRAQFSQPAGVGRLRGFDLRHHLDAVLVRWLAARSGYVAGSLQQSLGARDLRDPRYGMARFSPPLAEIRNRHAASGRT